MTQLSLLEAIKRIKVIHWALEYLETVPHRQEIEDIVFRLKTYQFYSPEKMLEIYHKTEETLNKIDSPFVTREEVPYIVRDVLKRVGLGTEVPHTQPLAREALRKAYRAAEAVITYYQENPDKPFNIKKAGDIVARQLVERKNKWVNA